jgi:hypothetical protein
VGLVRRRGRRRRGKLPRGTVTNRGKPEDIDWKELQVTAMQIGLSLDEFWGHPGDIDTGLTLREFDYCVEAYSRRMEGVQAMMAWHAANIMNVWTKRPVQPEKLLGKQKKIDLDEFMGGGSKNPADSLKETLRKQNEELQKKRDVAADLEPEEFDISELESDNAAWIDSILEATED